MWGNIYYYLWGALTIFFFSNAHFSLIQANKRIHYKGKCFNTILLPLSQKIKLQFRCHTTPPCKTSKVRHPLASLCSFHRNREKVKAARVEDCGAASKLILIYSEMRSKLAVWSFQTSLSVSLVEMKKWVLTWCSTYKESNSRCSIFRCFFKQTTKMMTIAPWYQ